MGKIQINLPDHLANGETLPNKYKDYFPSRTSAPKYRIVIYSIDRLYRHYRLVYSFYVFILSDDPSKIKKLITANGYKFIQGYENGQPVKDLLSCSIFLEINEMTYFKGRFMKLIDENRDTYEVVNYHNLVQYVNEPDGEPIVMTSVSFSSD